MIIHTVDLSLLENMNLVTLHKELLGNFEFKWSIQWDSSLQYIYIQDKLNKFSTATKIVNIIF